MQEEDGKNNSVAAAAAPFDPAAEKWWVFGDNEGENHDERYHEYPGIETEGDSIVIIGSGDDGCGVRGDTTEIRRARARLIAAAPDLLAALKSAEKILLAQGNTPARIHHIRAAITKATQP